MKPSFRLLPVICALLISWLEVAHSDIGQVTTTALQEEAPSASRRLVSQCAADLAEAENILMGLEQDAGPGGDDILERYNKLLVLLLDGGQRAGLMQRVHPDPAIREAAADCQRQFADLETRARLARPLYEAIADVDVSKADPKTQRFVELTLRDFRLAGVDKDDRTRARIRALGDEIATLEQAYIKNITDDVRSITVDSRLDLSGMPEDWIETRRPAEDGTVRVTTDYPDYMPFMRYAERDDLRRALFLAFNNRGYPANSEILRKLIEKRHEIARLQGFDSWADRAGADKMVGNAARARKFIDAALAASRPRAEADYGQLLQQRRVTEPEAQQVYPWQASYLLNKQREELFNVSSEQLRQYLDYRRVRDGIFDLTTDLFGIQIRKRQDADVWHESVEAYEFVENGRILGRFYLDMHPRDGKYKHASHVYYRVGLKDRLIPESVLVCNFPGGQGETSKMEHRQVETFLHEFGHLVHYHLRYQQPWVGISQPERDFIEAPSKMLEEWIYDADTLRRFAISDDGQPIPADLVERTRAARGLGEGLRVWTQLTLADLSLSLHDRPPESFELDTLYDEIGHRNAIIPHVAESRKYASFGHLGQEAYSASYYTYVWSQAIATDMLARFESAGLRDRDTAMAYRRIVLEAGGSRPAAEFIADFLGRPFSLEAFERHLSLSPTDEQ